MQSWVESDPQIKKAEGINTIWRQRCQNFYPILVIYLVSISLSEESVFLAKVAFKFLQNNPGDCYHNPRQRY
jgi:hypothetical protein